MRRTRFQDSVTAVLEGSLLESVEGSDFVGIPMQLELC